MAHSPKKITLLLSDRQLLALPCPLTFSEAINPSRTTNGLGSSRMHVLLRFLLLCQHLRFAEKPDSLGACPGVALRVKMSSILTYVTRSCSPSIRYEQAPTTTWTIPGVRNILGRVTPHVRPDAALETFLTCSCFTTIARYRHHHHLLHRDGTCGHLVSFKRGKRGGGVQTSWLAG